MHLTLSGTCLKIFNVGVLITGASGAGKSELALALIKQGHQLIADDHVQISHHSNQQLIVTSPPLLQELIEIREIGVLNIRHLFGEQSLSDSVVLQLIIYLEQMTREQFLQLPRLASSAETQTILSQAIPKRYLYATPGRNLSLLVECLVKDFLLRERGVDVTKEFIEKQQRVLVSKS